MIQKIAIFASGSGSNAENIAQYFKGSDQVSIALIVCDNPKAFVLERAKKLNIPTVIINPLQLKDTDYMQSILNEYEIDFIVLAGFLKLIPTHLVKAYPDKIINIHPALLPKYGGKGMYGHHVHEAVVEAKEQETGITVHFVNEHYDEGQIIFQAKCQVSPKDTPDDVADKIHELEMEHFPKVIEDLI